MAGSDARVWAVRSATRSPVVASHQSYSSNRRAIDTP